MPTLKSATAALPRQILPMLATSSPPFDDAGWLFEIKWDGVRALTSVTKNAWRVWGREGVDYTDRYPELAALRRLPAGTVLDGELVVIREARPDFLALMSRHARRPRPGPFFVEAVQYIVFDILYCRGQRLMDRPLAERRALLHKRLGAVPFVSLCEGMVGNGKKFFRSAIASGHEGVVAKKLDSPYLPNKRVRTWKQIKQSVDLPCVVMGYRTGTDGLRDLLMATLVHGRPEYVGVVELGIRQPVELLRRLNSLRTRRSAFPCSLSARWVKPELFCTVRCCGWRPGGVWRDPVLLAWEEAL